MRKFFYILSIIFFITFLMAISPGRTNLSFTAEGLSFDKKYLHPGKADFYYLHTRSADEYNFIWWSPVFKGGSGVIDFDSGGQIEYIGGEEEKYIIESLYKRIPSPYPGLDNFKDYNLIIIGFEPLGARHIGAYGYFRDVTPNIDKFSKSSFLFKNAISPSSWTLPVFMSWFTSLYPSQHKLLNKYSKYTKEEKIFSNLSELCPSAITLAQVLKRNGYSTAGFTGGAGVTGTFGYNLGFDGYYDQTSFGGFDLVFPMALDWLKKHKQEKFFLFIQGYDMHGRYPLPKDFKNRFADSNYRGKYRGTVEEYWELRDLSLEQGSLNLTDEDIRFWRDWYDGKIYEADKKFGEFLKELDKLGLTDKTIIVISSASGNEFYEHERFDHGYSLYEELIHVPLIIKIPGKEARVIENQVRTIDIMPTVLELLNVDYDKRIKKQIQGVSLVPLMRAEDLQLDAFSETDYLLYTFKRSLRTNDGWKFIYSMDTEQRELYNLKEDPYELNNLVEKEKEIADELEQSLFIWLNCVEQDKYHQEKLLKDVPKIEVYD